MASLRNVLLVLCLGATAYLAHVAFSTKAQVAAQQVQLATVQSDLRALGAKPPEKRVSLELQGKCAEQARRFFEEGGNQLGAHGDTAINYTSHYEPKAQRCFIQTNSWTYSAKSKSAIQLMSVDDAFEGKELANFASVTGADQTERLMQCVVGEDVKSHCKTRAEFENLIIRYME